MAYGRTMGSFLSLGSLMVMDATMAKQGHMVTDLSLGDTPYVRTWWGTLVLRGCPFTLKTPSSGQNSFHPTIINVIMIIILK